MKSNTFHPIYNKSYSFKKEIGIKRRKKIFTFFVKMNCLNIYNKNFKKISFNNIRKEGDKTKFYFKDMH